MRFALHIKPEYVEAVSNELLKRARGLLAYPIDTTSVRVSTDFQEYWNDNVNYNPEIPKEIKEMLNLYDGREKDNIYNAFIQDKYIEELINGAREIKRKIYMENVGRKSRKEIKKEIRQAVKKYMEENAGLLLERYKEELKRKAGDELKNKIEEFFSANNLKDYYEKLSHIKFVGIDSTLEDPTKSAEDYLHSLLKEEAAADYLTRKGLYFISGDGELKRAKNYKEIFHKLSKQERKKVKEYEKKLGLRKSKLLTWISIGSLLGLSAAALAYASMDPDHDGLRNLGEIHHRTDPHNPDTDGDGINDYEEIFKYNTNPLKPDSDYDGLTDFQEIFNYSTDPLDPDCDKDNLLDGQEIENKTDPFSIDTDGDWIRDDLEIFKHHTDPTKLDTDGDGIDDFNELFTYPHILNATKKDAEKLLSKIPNVQPMPWNESNDYIKENIGVYPWEGFIGRYKVDNWDHIIISISKRDPLVKFFAKHAYIEWLGPKKDPGGEWSYSNVGILKTYGGRISKEYGRGGPVQPSHFLTSGRIGTCQHASVTAATLLQLMGYDSVLVYGDYEPIGQTLGHQWVETVIDGEVYVVNFDGLAPRDEFYFWNPDLKKVAIGGIEGACIPYDPDWYKKGLHV